MKQISLSTLVVVSLFGVLFQGQLADAQSPTINCDNVDSISINIPIPDGDAWSQDDAAEWALNDSTEDSCTPAFSSGEWNYTFPAYTCANATTSGDGNFIHYTFEVSVEPTAGSGSGLEITQKNDHDYTFKCIYDKEHQLTAASFTPRISITGNETDNGVLTFGLELRRDNDDNPVDPDVPIDLTTPIYLNLKVNGDGDLDVHFLDVGTTDKEDGSSQIALVDEGCGVDAVVTAVSCNSDDEDKVDFDAYRFVTSVEGDDIYIFVTAEVCPADQVDSSCKTDCEACNPTKRRKRRETGQEIQQTQYYLKAGPYKINRNTEEARKDAAAGKDDVTHLPAYVVAVAAVGGVVAVAIVCATVLIVLRNRRQNTAIAEPRDQADVTA